MSYIAKCICCDCPIFMEDDFDENDDRTCEECRDDIYRFGHVRVDSDCLKLMKKRELK